MNLLEFSKIAIRSLRKSDDGYRPGHTAALAGAAGAGVGLATAPSIKKRLGKKMSHADISRLARSGDIILTAPENRAKSDPFPKVRDWRKAMSEMHPSKVREALHRSAKELRSKGALKERARAALREAFSPASKSVDLAKEVSRGVFLRGIVPMTGTGYSHAALVNNREHRRGVIHQTGYIRNDPRSFEVNPENRVVLLRPKDVTEGQKRKIVNAAERIKKKSRGFTYDARGGASSSAIDAVLGDRVARAVGVSPCSDKSKSHCTNFVARSFEEGSGRTVAPGVRSDSTLPHHIFHSPNLRVVGHAGKDMSMAEKLMTYGPRQIGRAAKFGIPAAAAGYALHKILSRKKKS